MKAYYHARAREYDDFWLRRGRFAGRDLPGWDEEREELVAMIRRLRPALTLDVACGTGFLTRHLPGVVTGLDQSDAMIEVAREQAPGVTFVVGDAFELPFADAAFDRVFASEPGPGDARARLEERVLDDGSRWQVFKRVFEADELAAERGGGRVLHDGRWFVSVAA